MVRFSRIAPIALGFSLLVSMIFSTDLWAFSVSEKENFNVSPYLFKMEVQVHGTGKLKKGAIILSSIKVKIKNETGKGGVLQVKAIRAYQESTVFKDIETKGFSVFPGQWVTKYYRLGKARQALLNENGFVEVLFKDFAIQFNPRQRKFQGPIR